jgi:transposase
VPLLSLLIEEIRSGPLINSDESTFQVMGEPGRKNTSTSYIWVFRGGPMDRPAVIYQYEPTRSSSVPNTFFAGYKGYVQVDGYAGYDALDRTDGITLVGCWAHARRKFDEAAKANRKGKKSKMRAADIALRYIRQLYAVEHEAEGLEPDERRQLRQAKAWPMLTEFGDWLRQTYPQTPPKGLLGKAIHYTLQQWERLTVYLEDGRLKPDNNLAENAIRPFVVGRKNWLFAGSPDGARASALLYSLVETAKLNGLEPYRYIHFLLEKIVVAKERDDFLDLLPNRVRKEEIDSFPFFLPDSR